MHSDSLTHAIEKLALDFKNLRWKYPETPAVISEEKIQLWPGDENEDVVICVAKGNDASEQFHRQDFFFFNFAYKGDYSAISYKFDNKITVHEGECYVGQPCKQGYAAHFLYHPNYISTLLHKELGLTFSAIQNNQRMEKAAMLLRGTDLSVEEISEMLGYSSPSNFYKAFKKHYGTSPREIGEI